MAGQKPLVLRVDDPDTRDLLRDIYMRAKVDLGFRDRLRGWLRTVPFNGTPTATARPSGDGAMIGVVRELTERIQALEAALERASTAPPPPAMPPMPPQVAMPPREPAPTAAVYPDPITPDPPAPLPPPPAPAMDGHSIGDPELGAGVVGSSALAAADARRRRVMAMRAYGFSSAQIARRLGLPLAVVERTIRNERARAAMDMDWIER